MTASTSSTRTKRSTAIRLSLAGLALVGIGAAATTAAWTDNVLFNATATTSTFNLEGSVNGTTFTDGPLTIDGTAFAGLTPGDSKSATITIKNAGALPATLSSATATTSGTGVFLAGTPATVSVTGLDAGTVLAPGATRALTVTVTAPAAWPNSYQGQSAGTLQITVDGASS